MDSGYRCEWCFRGVVHMLIGGRHAARIKKNGKMRQEEASLSPGNMYNFNPYWIEVIHR